MSSSSYQSMGRPCWTGWTSSDREMSFVISPWSLRARNIGHIKLYWPPAVIISTSSLWKRVLWPVMKLSLTSLVRRMQDAFDWNDETWTIYWGIMFKKYLNIISVPNPSGRCHSNISIDSIQTKMWPQNRLIWNTIYEW